MKALNTLATLLAVETISLCLIASYRIIFDHRATLTLLIFNLFFASVIFQLNGTFPKKIYVLTIGNAIGLFLNIIFFYFSTYGCSIFGQTFNAFYTLIFPILNLMWIIPFWSLSLGFLPIQLESVRQGKD